MNTAWIALAIIVTPTPSMGDTTATSSTTATASVATVTEPEPEASEVPPSVDERVTELEGKLGDLTETTTELRNVVDILARLKLTAYAQARFEWHEDAEDGVSDAGRPTNTTQFSLRRGRLKATWGFEVAELMMQLDATPRGVSIKDLEATFIEPWTGQYSRFTIGQFKWPFGYEVLQSSEQRQMPERSRIVRALFPGERDRGARVQIYYDWLRASAALVNGNGTEDSIYGANDANAFKDVVGRVGVEFDHVVAGVSAYYGQGLATKLGSSTAVPPTETTETEYDKVRLGADVQFYVDVPSLGGLALKGEVMGGSEAKTTPWGLWVLASQNIGDSLGVFARVDLYDPDLDTDDDGILTVGGGAQYFINGFLKASLTYEHPQALAGTDPSDDNLTLQLQASFH